MEVIHAMGAQSVNDLNQPMRGRTSRRSQKSGLAGKIVSAADAVRLIHAGDTVAMGGLVGIGVAEEIALAIEERFLRAWTAVDDADSLKDLTLVFAAAQGDGRATHEMSRSDDSRRRVAFTILSPSCTWPRNEKLESSGIEPRCRDGSRV
jgi:hypothetical protein